MQQQNDTDTYCSVLYRMFKACCCDYYTVRQQVLRHRFPLGGGFYVSFAAICSRLINVIGCVVFFIVIMNGHALWAEEKPIIVPMLRKANEWLYFDSLRTLANSTGVSTFDCADTNRDFVLPVAYESTRFNSVLCDSSPLSSLPTFNSTSWSCLSELSSKVQISAATDDSNVYLQIPTATIEYATKDRLNVPDCNSNTSILSAVSFVRDVELSVVELGFFVSDMYRFLMQADTTTNADLSHQDNTITAFGGEFESVKLVGSNGATISNCINADTGVLGTCEWQWVSGEEPSRITVTVGNLLAAAGLSSLQDSNAAFQSYYSTRSMWPTASTVTYPYQLTGIELVVVVRWNNAPVCEGAEFLVGDDEAGCSYSTAGAQPMVAEVSVSYNPVFRPLQTSASADGSYSEQFGIRITMAGGGYIVDDEYDVWLLYIPIIYALIVVGASSCCTECLLYLRCKESLPAATSLPDKLWFCCSAILIRCGGHGMPNDCESLSKKCRNLWHAKPRIAHIRKKFCLQRNYHKAQDDILDENQVHLHRVAFKPQGLTAGAKQGEISRQRIEDHLADVQTNRSQLDRLVRKEREHSRNPDHTYVNSRLAVLKLLLTSGVSENEIEMNVDYAPTRKDQHRNLLRAIFLEFADVLAEDLHRRGMNIRPPSREMSNEELPSVVRYEVADDENSDVASVASSTKDLDDSDDVPSSGRSMFDGVTSGEDATDSDDAARKPGGSLANMDRTYEFAMELQNVGFDFSSDEDDDGEDGAFEGI